MRRVRAFLRQSVGLLAALLSTAALRAGEPGIESSFFDAAGVKIHYVRGGAGEPVVLIHGLYSSAAMNWQMPGEFAALARDHNVIALDLPGHGQSDKPDEAAAYGVQMAEDVRLLMDRLGIPKAHIVGYSLGGLVALKFISLHPDRVLSGTLGGFMPEGGAMQKSWAHLGGRSFSSTPPICVHEIAQLAMTKGDLLAIKAPMEIIIGEKDPVRKLYVDPLVAIRNDWPVVIIPGAGHIACVTKQAFKDELVRWIDVNRQQ